MAIIATNICSHNLKPCPATTSEWKNQNQIHERVGTNRDRLNSKLARLKKLGHIRNDWNDLPMEDQKKYRKEHPNFEPKGVKYFYKITERGHESFRKIRDNCLDPDTSRLLRVYEFYDKDGNEVHR